jgi:hypothetical protein
MSDLRKVNFPEPMPGGTRVHVTVPASLSFNFEKLQAMTKTILTNLGCAACHSGFDFTFIRELDFSFNERGELIQG